MADQLGFVDFTDFGNDASAIDAAIARHEAWRGHPTIVQVQAVNPGDGFVGAVDVKPMVHQIDGAGSTIEHGTIYTLPYLRIQGGANAIIIDPEVGDIGFMIVAGRDITNVIATRKPSAPGSFRIHDMADAVYVGGFLNAAPTQFIQFTGDGIKIVSPKAVTIQADSAEIKCDLKVDGAITATGDIKAGSISLETHVHSEVQAGSDTTGTPE